ncbi:MULTISPECIES: DUF4915 domain-containing protein [Shewanella]|uniref:DUF4915 domain-containing protein n=1 Tax=Shewanella TaxID=22 RepID=UPI001BC57D0E|nr:MULTISPECIES: DUF4915 domain-containing protein [Shewanella]GIU50566.1 hypothetical protein TUM4249_11630 [Shewanella sp. KT0246]
MKKIILFGSGTVAEKNLHLMPEFIVDNSVDLQGSLFHGVPVKSPNELNGLSAHYKVIVCTTSVTEVKHQLNAYGFVWGQDADVAELLSERMEMSQLEETQFQFLVSSGLPSSAETFSGGGIYLIQETDEYPSAKQLFKGNTHGLIRHDDEGFAFSSQGDGIMLMNKDFEVCHQIELPEGLRAHGLRKYKSLWVIVSSYGDCIIGVNHQGKEVFKYKFSEKLARFGSAQHHCNDIFIVDDFAYVSMFSVTGNWKRNSFDGGIIEVDLITGEMNVIINNLTMPHSVICDEFGLKVLNSFKGTLLGNNFDVLATLPGFVRGYDSDHEYHYIGESKNRNFSRLETGRTPVSIDTRITIVNKKFNFSRSIQLPKKVSEIHSVIKL